jgi:hypothetical protein
MKIILTGIKDTTLPVKTKTEINKQKVELANTIMHNISPYLDNQYLKINDELKIQKKELLDKRKLIKERKDLLVTIDSSQKIIKKKKILLDRIERLIENKTIQQNLILKKQTVILLKILNTLQEDQIDYHLNTTLKLLNKKAKYI